MSSDFHIYSIEVVIRTSYLYFMNLWANLSFYQRPAFDQNYSNMYTQSVSLLQLNVYGILFKIKVFIAKLASSLRIEALINGTVSKINYLLAHKI